MSEGSRSPLEEAFGETLGSKYVRLAEREHTVAEQVVLDDMGDAKPHGLKPPAVTVQSEKPEHTFLAYKFAQGGSSKEVFEHFGGKWDSETNLPVSGTGRWAYATILNIRRQPWFISRVTSILREAGLDQVTAALKAELPAAIDTAREVMNNPEEKGATRLAAASFFFDRALGKATQHIKHEEVKSVDNYEADLRKIKRELETVEAEIISINSAEK